MSSLTFELDVAPSDFYSARPIDFATRLVTAFTRMPPFRPSEWGTPPEPNLIAAAEPTLGGRQWTLHPHLDNRWSSGRRMALSEIADGIAAPARAVGPQNSWALSLIEHVAIERGAIVVELKRPNAVFPSLLTMDVFAPRPESDAEASGPFSYVRQHARDIFVFRRNAVGDYLWPSGPETILFVVTKNAAQGVRMFEQGLIDVTCNPNLPAASLDAYSGSPTLWQRDLLMVGALIFASPELRNPAARDFRRQISDAIDRERAASVQIGLRPLRCFTDLWRSKPAQVEFEPFKKVLSTSRSLVLAYANFEPNLAVVESIADDLRKRLGLKLVLRAMSYDEYLSCLSKPDADLIYSLVQPPYNDPTSMFTSFISLLSNRQACYRTAVEAAEGVLNTQDRLEACGSAAEIFRQEVPLTPIVRATSKCLVSSYAASISIGPDGIFRPPLNKDRPCPSH